MDIIFTIGQYTIVSMYLNSAGVQLEKPDRHPPLTPGVRSNTLPPRPFRNVRAPMSTKTSDMAISWTLKRSFIAVGVAFSACGGAPSAENPDTRRPRSGPTRGWWRR